MIGSLSSAISGMRFIWSMTMDQGRFDYYDIYGFVICLQFTLSSVTFYAAQNEWTYLIVSCLALLTYGAPFVLLPVHINEICSDNPLYGVKLYALVFSFAGTTTFFLTESVQFMTKYDITFFDSNNVDYSMDGVNDPEVFKSILAYCSVANIVALFLLRKYYLLIKSSTCRED